jgi:hypothetical protein
MMKGCKFLILFLYATGIGITPGAFAANQVVSDCGDTGGANQLRAKINASQSSGGGAITFTCGLSTIVLTSVLPSINTTETTIDGGGNIILSGNPLINVAWLFPHGRLHSHSQRWRRHGCRRL